jgi:hypothetical protein
MRHANRSSQRALQTSPQPSRWLPTRAEGCITNTLRRSNWLILEYHLFARRRAVVESGYSGTARHVGPLQ